MRVLSQWLVIAFVLLLYGILAIVIYVGTSGGEPLAFVVIIAIFVTLCLCQIITFVARLERRRQTHRWLKSFNFGKEQEKPSKWTRLVWAQKVLRGKVSVADVRDGEASIGNIQLV